MKSLHKSLVILCAILMILGCTMPVLVSAEPAEPTGSITVKAPSGVTLKGRTLEALQLFSAKDLAMTGTQISEIVYDMTPAQLAIAQNIKGIDGLDVSTDDTKEETLKKIREYLSPAAPNNPRTAAELEKFAQAVLKADQDDPNHELPSTPLTVDSEGKSATATGLKMGYYMIVDKTTDFKGDLQTNTKSLVMLQHTKPDIEVDLKATSVPFDKKIDNNVVGDGNKKNDPESESADLVYDTHSIGEIVKYKLTSVVPDMYGYDHYYFGLTDTLAKGLLYQKDLTIKIGDKTLKENTDYVLTVTPNPATGEGETSIKFYLKNALDLFKGHKGEKILVNYTAKVTKDADTTTAGNENKAKVWFKRNPDEGGTNDNPDNPSGETPEKHTKTFVTEFKLFKTDDTGKAPLAGATFTLTGDRVKTVKVTGQEYIKEGSNVDAKIYTKVDDTTYYQLTDGTYTAKEPTTETEKKYKSTTDKYKLYDFVKWENEDGTATSITKTTGPDGMLTFTGLGAGTYTLKETKAPAGYNPAKDYNIKITCTPNDPKGAKGGTGENNCTWKYEYKLADEDETQYKTFTNIPEGSALADQNNEITIKNTSTTPLPETGGIGTTIFYTVGGLLALVAVVVLVSRKRMLSSQR